MEIRACGVKFNRKLLGDSDSSPVADGSYPLLATSLVERRRTDVCLLGEKKVLNCTNRCKIAKRNVRFSSRVFVFSELEKKKNQNTIHSPRIRRGRVYGTRRAHDVCTTRVVNDEK